MPLLSRTNAVGVQETADPVGVDRDQLVLQALRDAEVFMRVADEDMNVIRVFFDLFEFRCASVGYECAFLWSGRFGTYR
jgi:hypothetical protein